MSVRCPSRIVSSSSRKQSESQLFFVCLFHSKSADSQNFLWSIHLENDSLKMSVNLLNSENLLTLHPVSVSFVGFEMDSPSVV